MKRFCSCFFLLMLLVFVLGSNQAFAQSWPDYPQLDPNDPHTIYRGPGGYFAVWKLLLIALFFLIWIKLASWVNCDSIKYLSQHELHPHVWNPIMLFVFLAGLFGAVINIPFFVLGFPLYLLCVFGPWVTYLLMRKGKVDPAALAKEAEDAEANLPGGTDLPVQFKAAGNTGEEAQSNLILARQSESFSELAQLLYDAAFQRTEQIVFDYTKDGVSRKQQIDGAWIDMEPMDRPNGDAMLVSLKHLANLNPADRRSHQQGKFGTKVRRLEIKNLVTTQGVQTGERVTLRFETEQKQPLELMSLGMWPDMHAKLKAIIDGSGFVVVSAPPGHGLTTTWKAVLHGTDRYTRDWVSIIESEESDSEMENIDANVFNRRNGQSPVDLLANILLKEPVGFVVPELINSASIDALADQVVANDRTVVTRVRAKSAAEAILRIMLLSEKNRGQFLKAVELGICQRLVRRLCDSCKQELPPNPKLIQQLGGNPNEPKTIYTHYRKPPPEQLVDDRGRPIELQPCQTCSGIGYIGRIAVYELLFVNDKIREAIRAEAKLESVQKASLANGNLSLPQQGYRLVLEGVTSIEEVQRIMKQ